mgnify:CR=1 FL=1
MQKRTFVRALSAVTLTLPLGLASRAFAQASATSRIALLTELVKTLGAAGDALTKLTDGFKSLIIAGNDAYNHVAAERERARLIDISRRTASLIGMQSVTVVQGIDSYLARRVKTQADWSNLVQNLGSTLTSVHELLTDVQKENGSFVLESAYLTLSEALSGRVQILTELMSMPAPVRRDELALLREANVRYKALAHQAKQALGELNTYVKAHKG